MLSLTSNRWGKQNSLRMLTALTWPAHSAVVRCETVDAKLRLQPRQIPHAEFFLAAMFARILTAIDTLLTIVWHCVAHRRVLCRQTVAALREAKDAVSVGAPPQSWSWPTGRGHTDAEQI
jgi:hypothetical protein